MARLSQSMFRSAALRRNAAIVVIPCMWINWVSANGSGWLRSTEAPAVLGMKVDGYPDCGLAGKSQIGVFSALGILSDGMIF